MTIGEKLLELFPAIKCNDGVYEFTYLEERDGMRYAKKYKGRLDNEYIKAFDGGEYVVGRCDNANFGIRKVFDLYHYHHHVRSYGEAFIDEQKRSILVAMVMGIASKQCKMLSPIYITYYTEGINVIFIGTAFVEERLIDKLKYLKDEVAQG